MSQQPTTRSSSEARGTKSWIRGLRLSVRLPRRMVASWVSEPVGAPRPRRMASMPARNVVVTAPMPGTRTPSFPVAGAIRTLSLLGKTGLLQMVNCYNSNSMRQRATATLTTVVVDDEQLACDELSYLLRDFPEVEIAGTGSNGLEAVELIEKLEPDLVFLDVQMPGLDGLGVVRRLREKGIDLPHFIIVTAYDQYAVEAFRLEAMDYLLKPVEKARLAETIERARREIQERQPKPAQAPPRASAPRTKLLVRASARNFIVDAQDVIYATIDNGLIT